MNVKNKNSMVSTCIVLAFLSIIITGSFGMVVYGQNNSGSSNVIDLTETRKKSQDVSVDVDLNDLKMERVGGTISSLQTDDNNTSWVTSGKWDLQSNPSNTANSSRVTFSSTIDMRGINNSLPHTHKISEFKLTKTSVDSGDEGTVLTFNGTANIESPFGSNTEVPIVIKLIDSGQVLLSADAQSGVVEPKWVPKGGIIILLIEDPKLQEHFGSSPVYGTVKKQ